LPAPPANATPVVKTKAETATMLNTFFITYLLKEKLLGLAAHSGHQTMTRSPFASAGTAALWLLCSIAPYYNCTSKAWQVLFIKRFNFLNSVLSSEKTRNFYHTPPLFLNMPFSRAKY